FRLRQGVGEDGLRRLVHRGCDRPLGRRPVRTHGLVAAAAHRVNAGLLEGSEAPLTTVVAKPLEHPFMGSVGAGGETIERQDHLEDYFSIAHDGSDRSPRINSSLIGGVAKRTHAGQPVGPAPLLVQSGYPGSPAALRASAASG